jgi:hypothetical protein
MRCLACLGLFLLLTPSLAELCGVSAYFNPLHYRSRLVNFIEARQWSRRQGLRVLVVELAFGDDTFELSQHISEQDELTRLVQLRTIRDNLLWQKEALLNIGFARIDECFPSTCTNIVWLDSDVVLEDGWIEAAEDMLTRVEIGQVFTHLIRLPQGVFSPFAYWSEPRMKRMGQGNREGQVQFAASMAFGGHTGFAWAVRRRVLENEGLYDRCVVGGFDALLFHALNDPRCETRLNQAMADHFDAWWARFDRLPLGRAGFPNQTIKAAAFWHGDIKDRTYQDRHAILLKHNFDPARHVRVDESGALGWTEEASCDLRRDVFTMFVQRREDGPLDSTFEDPEFSCEEECLVAESR